MAKIAEAPLLRELKNSFKIGDAKFPKRAGWDFEEAFSSRIDDSPFRHIFVLRQRLIENGHAGKNYKRGVAWTGEGYIDVTYFVDSREWTTHDGIYEAVGYETAESPMSYSEKWELYDLEGRFI